MPGPARVGVAFGIISGLLFLLAGVVEFIFGVAAAILFRSAERGLLSTVVSVEEVVFGILVLVMTGLAARRLYDFRLAGGAALIVLAIVAYLLFGGPLAILVVLAVVFGLVGGVLLVVPSR